LKNVEKASDVMMWKNVYRTSICKIKLD